MFKSIFNNKFSAIFLAVFLLAASFVQPAIGGDIYPGVCEKGGNPCPKSMPYECIAHCAWTKNQCERFILSFEALGLATLGLGLVAMAAIAKCSEIK